MEAGAFCTRCGARLEAGTSVQPKATGVQTGISQVPTGNHEVQKGNLGTPVCYPGTPTIVISDSQDEAKKKRKRNAKLILIAVLLIAAFVGGILVYREIDNRKQEKVAAAELAEFATALQGTYYSVYEDYNGAIYISLSLNANNTYVVYDTYTGQVYYSGRYEVIDYDRLLINGTYNELLIYDNGFSVSDGFCTDIGELWYFSRYF